MFKWIEKLIGVAAAKVALVPEGFVLVPEKPSEAHIESMCLRFDHSHGCKHSFPVEESEAHFQARRNFNRSIVIQLYEEATGQGFYKFNQEPSEPDWMGRDDLISLREGNAALVADERSAQMVVVPVAKPTLEEINPYLEECTIDANGTYYYSCQSCQQTTEVYEPERFDPMMHYCGGSLRCCP